MRDRAHWRARTVRACSARTSLASVGKGENYISVDPHLSLSFTFIFTRELAEHDSMRRADRLIKVVKILRRGPDVTIDALAAEMGVSRRSIYRDLRAIRNSGLVIDGGPEIGIHLDPGLGPTTLVVEADELFALGLGARMVGRFADRAISAAAVRALTKIEVGLPSAAQRALRTTPLAMPSPAEPDTTPPRTRRR